MNNRLKFDEISKPNSIRHFEGFEMAVNELIFYFDNLFLQTKNSKRAPKRPCENRESENASDKANNIDVSNEVNEIRLIIWHIDAKYIFKFKDFPV